jgi:hypothetical protein
MGNHNHAAVSHKLCGFQGHVSGHIVMMKEPNVVAPKFWSFLSHVSSQVFQNITVKVRVDCSVRRNTITVNNPLYIEKNNENSLCLTPDLLLLFCPWWLWDLPLRWLLLCFWIITVNPTSVTCYDPRDTSKIWVPVTFSRSSRHVYALLHLIICEELGNKFRSIAAHVQIFC